MIFIASVPEGQREYVLMLQELDIGFFFLCSKNYGVQRICAMQEAQESQLRFVQRIRDLGMKTAQPSRNYAIQEAKELWFPFSLFKLESGSNIASGSMF